MPDIGKITKSIKGYTEKYFTYQKKTYVDTKVFSIWSTYNEHFI